MYVHKAGGKQYNTPTGDNRFVQTGQTFVLSVQNTHTELVFIDFLITFVELNPPLIQP